MGKREAAIPWSSVTSLDNGVHLSLTSDAVKELPLVSVLSALSL